MLVTMMILPLVFGVNGIWLATPVAELMALALSIFMFLKYRKRCGYQEKIILCNISRTFSCYTIKI